MSFTLRQLQVFDAVAREASVTRAAEQLHMTQSAASMALRSFEEAIGQELFVRHGRTLALGVHGRMIQPMARSILAAASEMQRAVREDAPREELLIGASPTVAHHLMGELVNTFLQAHRNVHVSLLTLPAQEVIRRVDEMALDVGVVEMATARSTVRPMTWRTEPFTIFCAPDHALAARPDLTPADLGKRAWCLPPRLHDVRWQFTHRLMALVEEIDIVLESDSTSVIVEAVAGGAGLGCLPRSTVERALADGVIVELRVRDLQLQMPITVIMRDGMVQSGAHAGFLDLFKSPVLEDHQRLLQ